MSWKIPWKRATIQCAWLRSSGGHQEGLEGAAKERQATTTPTFPIGIWQGKKGIYILLEVNEQTNPTSVKWCEPSWCLKKTSQRRLKRVHLTLSSSSVMCLLNWCIFQSCRRNQHSVAHYAQLPAYMLTGCNLNTERELWMWKYGKQILRHKFMKKYQLGC